LVAYRFGAITGNGEGEKLLGQVMMLKDANSKQSDKRCKSHALLKSKVIAWRVYINGF
jgi:cobalt-zinc-cadmium resistance protein CzcA